MRLGGQRFLAVLALAIATVAIGATGEHVEAGAASPTWGSPVTIVQNTGFSGNQVNAVSCPSASLCVAVGVVGNMAASTNPNGGSTAWSQFKVGTNTFTSVSCPSTSLCVAVGAGGTIATSTQPTKATWTAVDADTTNTLESVSCPSSSLCVAVDDHENVVTSTNPTSGVWAVAKTTVTSPLYTVSCPSTSLCVASSLTATNGSIWSTNPTGGTQAWQVFSGDPAFTLSCPTASFCASAYGRYGYGLGAYYVTTSTDPTGGTGSWATTPAIDTAVLTTLSCPTASFCMATDYSGNALLSTSPTGGPTAWSKTANPIDIAGSESITGLSCPTTTLCVAVDATGRAIVWTSAPSQPPPTPPVRSLSWGSPVTIVQNTGFSGNQVNAVSCPSASLCVAVGVVGNMAASTNPNGGSTAWSQFKVGTNTFTSVSCPSTSLCVAVGAGGTIATSTQPTKATWTAVDADTTNTLESVSCPSSSLCVAVDDHENVVTSTNPTSGVWAVAKTTVTSPLYTVSCPSTSLCVASSLTATNGSIWSTNPTGGTQAWQVFSGDPAFTLSCPTASFCASAYGRYGYGLGAYYVTTSTDPTGGTGSENDTYIDTTVLTTLSCPTASFCMATDYSGNALLSTSPTGGPTAWSKTANPIDIAGSESITGLSCPTTTLCVAVDATGRAIVGVDVPPSTAVLAPAGGSVVHGSASVLDASASDNIGVSSVKFVLTGGTYNKTVIGTASPTLYGYLLSWNTTSVPNGTYTLQSLATDTAGNTAYSAGVTITVDNSPPATSVLIAPAGGNRPRAPASLDATASDNIGVGSVKFVLTGGTLQQDGHRDGVPHPLRLPAVLEHDVGSRRDLHAPEPGDRHGGQHRLQRRGDDHRRQHSADHLGDPPLDRGDRLGHERHARCHGLGRRRAGDCQGPVRPDRWDADQVGPRHGHAHPLWLHLQLELDERPERHLHAPEPGDGHAGQQHLQHRGDGHGEQLIALSAADAGIHEGWPG